MTQTATRRRNGTAPKEPASTKPKPRAKAATEAKASSKPRRGPAAAAKKTARKATEALEAVEEHTPDLPTPNRPARKLAGKAIKKFAKTVTSKTLEATAGLIRAAADRAAATSHEAAEKTAHKRLPIQRHVDIAVPIRVAWEEWMALEHLPEGVHTVVEIERDGDELLGRTSGPRPTDWSAEVIDEREQQSFAWQSHEGSDCAGLATFHDLSERLTRIELTLDVIPTSLAETFELTVHLADKKAEKDLRRLKARLELINPDLYETGDEEEAPEAEDPDTGDDAPEDERQEDDTDEQDEAA